jgi:hypothetical protein
MSFFLLQIWVEQVLLGGWYQSKGEEVGKRCRRMNTYKYCVHMYVNGKMRPVESIPEMRGEG